MEFPFLNFPFFSLNGAFCWLGAAGRGQGFFAQKGGRETMPWHSQGLRERGGDCTENTPLSVRPAWAQLFSVREKAFMHQARAYFPVSVQPNKLKMLATRPLEHQVFMENFRTAQLNFWKQCQYILIFVRFVVSFKRFCAATGVTTNPRIQEKERGGVKYCALQLRRLSVCASTKSTRRTRRLGGCKKMTHT